MPDVETKVGDMMGGSDIKDIDAKKELDSEEKDVKDKEKKDKDGEVDEEKIKNHDSYKKLEKEAKEKGENLSKQGKVIEKLQKDIEALKKGGNAHNHESKQFDAPYKTIKRSKDLSKEEREEMTISEIQNMDDLADLKENYNKMAKERHDEKNAEKVETKEEKDEDDGEDDENKGKVDLLDSDSPSKDMAKEVKDIALELSGNDRAMANKIINEFNGFANNDQLSSKQLRDRLMKAAKIIPEYVAPKEQSIHNDGNTVKTDGKKKEDPFGNSDIVESVTKRSKGNYKL